MKTRREVSAGGVILRREGAATQAILASRRTRSGDLVWGLPKGLIEPGETPEEAAVREGAEETGFRGSVRESLGTTTYWYVWQGERVHKTVHFFLLDWDGVEPGPPDGEMEEVRWFDLEEASRIAGFESERQIILSAIELESRP